VLLILAGLLCLLISGYMMYRMMPRNGQEPPLRSDAGETAIALGQFTLLIAGITLLVKGLF
jgi:hypothetical protein